MQTLPLRLGMAAMIVIGLAGTTRAQFDVNGPNASLTLQGEVPSVTDPADHDVMVAVPGLFELQVESGVNPGVGLIMLASVVDPSAGGVSSVPWGGSIDIGTTNFGNIVVVGDGIGLSVGILDGFFVTDSGDPVNNLPPKFLMAFQAGIHLNSARVAFQSIVADPTMSPFMLDDTEAVDANFVTGNVTTLVTTSTSPAQVAFTPGTVFNFHGVSYTEVFVNANGYINFGNQTSVAMNGFTIDAQSWANAEPSIAPFLADWENTAAPEGILYEEVGTQLRIAWGDPASNPGGVSHFYDSDVNQFQVVMQLQNQAGTNSRDGEFQIDLLAIDPLTLCQNGDGLLGHTPGGMSLTTLPADTDQHIPQAALAGTVQAEEHNATGANASVMGYDGTGVGAMRAYNSIHSWNGQSVTYQPAPFTSIPGDGGYTSSASQLPPDDVLGVFPSGLDVSGGQTVTIVGKFYGFNDALGNGGSVVFDPNGTPAFPIIVGIFDSTGAVSPALPHNPATSPFRDVEGLQIITPAFTSTGMIDMQVNFNSGASFTVQVPVVNANQVFTSYSIPNNGIQQHVMQNTIDFYGTTYTSFFIHAHGYITFNSGNSDFSESMPELFAGWQASPTTSPRPGVAMMWSDMNFNNLGATFEVSEDTLLNTTQVTFRNQQHWVSGSPAGDASVTFNALGPNSLSFDHTNFLADLSPGGNTHGVIIGFTDGDDQTGIDTDLSDSSGTGISSVLGTYLSTGGPDSIGELFPVGVQPAITSWNALDIGDGLSTPFGTWQLF